MRWFGRKFRFFKHRERYLEPLEPRRHFSATAMLAANHVLYVLGTTDDESIAVMQYMTNIGITYDGAFMNVVAADGTNIGQSVDTAIYPVSRVNIRGFAGNDTMTVQSTVTEPVVITDGNGADNFQIGNLAPVAINAYGGNDTVTCTNGDDYISLGGGVDNINVGDGNDTVTTNGGNANSSDTFTLGDGNDFLSYVGGNDTIDVGTGQDSIYASGAADSQIYVNGGSGNDLFFGSRGTANLNLSNTTGNDIIHLNRGNTTLNAGSGNDLIFDEGGLDSVAAGVGADTILTLSGADTVVIPNYVNTYDQVYLETAGNVVTGNDSDTVYGSAAPNPNNTEIADVNWYPNLPANFSTLLAGWEAER